MNKEIRYSRYIKNNVISKVFSARMAVICLIQLIFQDMFLNSISVLAKTYSENVYPFIFSLLCGNLTFVMIFGFCVLYMYSEAPFMNQKELYNIVRTGRYKWLVSQEISITILAVFLILYSYLIEAIRLCPRVSFSNHWDRIELSLSYGTISSDIMGFEMSVLQKYSPWMVALYGIVMGVLVVNVVGHIMYTMSLLLNRVAAVLVGSFFAVMPIISNNSSNVYGWVYYLSPFSWMTPGYIIRSVSVPDFIYKLSTCLIGTFVCIVVDFLLMKKRDFDWNMEE